MTHDAIIIGTGQAGVPLAIRLAKAGKTVAIIEKGAYGGTCVNVGCSPTKAYVASAHRAFVARESADMGIVIDGKVRVDLERIKARKDKMIKDSHRNIAEAFNGQDNITIYHGKARFTGPQTIQVTDHALKAEQIFINVGARPRIPEGFSKLDYLTNVSILELTEIPEHLIIVGGSYIGLEFGQMFRRFGSKVTIVEMQDRLISREDKEESVAVQQILENEGIDIRLSAKCLSGRKVGQQLSVNLDCEDDDKEVYGSHVLLATGRIPNTDDLGLEHTKIETNKHGYITVNQQLETTVSQIWALGDCNGEGAFTHTAYNDYQIVADHILHDGKRKLSDRIDCYALYIDPPLARIGMTETQARNTDKKVKKATFEMANVARARQKGETQGQMKVLIDADTDKIIGASCLGTGSDECIHVLLDVMYADAPYTVIRDAVHIHPTVSELIPTMLESLE